MAGKENGPVSGGPIVPVIRFAGALEASRRVAGISAAGRFVRELAEAGVAQAWILLPPGHALSAGAALDVARLAGACEIRFAAADALPESAETPARTVILPGSRLVAARDLPAVLADPACLDHVRTTALDRPDAGRTILRATGKSGDGPVSRWINRPVSRRISALLLAVPGVRPIHATLGTLALAAAMLAVFLLGGNSSLLVAGLLFHAASVFDGVDGEIARATFSSSREGAMIDTAVDVATNLFFFGGLTCNLVSRGEPGAGLVALWGFVLFIAGLAAIAALTLRDGRHFSLDLVKRDYERRFEGRTVRLLINAATIVTSRDFFALLFALLLAAGWAMSILYLFAAAASIWILFVIGSVMGSLPPILASRRS